MPLHELQQLLNLNNKKKKYQFRINDNRSTMLSVKWEPDCTKVSLHKMFLSAPQNIMDQLACYLKRERKNISGDIREFIETNLQKLDYSYLVDQKKLPVRGDFYHLRDIYEQINAQYFDNKLNLNITWFGNPLKRNRSRITFGLYHEQMKLIKINRMMDSPSFPDYVVAFVVYHEMLHHVCPSYYDKNGRHQVHSKEFKVEEQKFEHFQLATNWIKAHQENLFTYI